MDDVEFRVEVYNDFEDKERIKIEYEIYDDEGKKVDFNGDDNEQSISIKEGDLTMSYVERAFYDYFINTMTAGVKTLLSRRFIFYTILLFIMITSSTGAAILYENDSEIMDEELLLIIFSAEMSLAFALIFSGVIVKQIKFFFGKWLTNIL